MHAEFRTLVAEATRLQEQLLDLRHRMQTGTPTDSGDIALHDLQERLDALFLRVGQEVPDDLVESRSGKLTYLFTRGHVEVEPRDKSGERFVNWLRNYPEDLDAFVRTMEVP